MHTILLDIILLNESHTGDLIAQKVCEVLQLYGLGKRLLGVTTHNGTNMISMVGKLHLQCLEEFDNSQVTHLCCAAHVLNLSVKKGLSMVSAPVKKARVFVNRLRNSPLLLGEMKSIALALDMNFLEPEGDVPTRWNSTYLMLRRLEKI